MRRFFSRTQRGVWFHPRLPRPPPRDSYRAVHPTQPPPSQASTSLSRARKVYSLFLSSLLYPFAFSLSLSLTHIQTLLLSSYLPRVTFLHSFTRRNHFYPAEVHTSTCASILDGSCTYTRILIYHVCVRSEHNVRTYICVPESPARPIHPDHPRIQLCAEVFSFWDWTSTPFTEQES